MTKDKPVKSVLVKLSSLPPSKTVRAWIKKHVPKGVKILYTLDSKS